MNKNKLRKDFYSPGRTNNGNSTNIKLKKVANKAQGERTNDRKHGRDRNTGLRIWKIKTLTGKVIEICNRGNGKY